MICILGKYLKERSIYYVLINNDILGQNMVKSVMDASNYKQGKRVIHLMADVTERFQISAFLYQTGSKRFTI